MSLEGGRGGKGRGGREGGREGGRGEERDDCYTNYNGTTLYK